MFCVNKALSKHVEIVCDLHFFPNRFSEHGSAVSKDNKFLLELI